MSGFESDLREKILGSSYNFQLRALADVLLRGAPVVTNLDDAIANMDVIDAAYLAAGLPLREPTVAS